ncbi:hypothetical protein ACWEOP_40270 [Streptomyces chartreusis]
MPSHLAVSSRGQLLRRSTSLTVDVLSVLASSIASARSTISLYFGSPKNS